MFSPCKCKQSQMTKPVVKLMFWPRSRHNVIVLDCTVLTQFHKLYFFIIFVYQLYLTNHNQINTKPCCWIVHLMTNTSLLKLSPCCHLDTVIDAVWTWTLILTYAQCERDNLKPGNISNTDTVKYQYKPNLGHKTKEQRCQLKMTSTLTDPECEQHMGSLHGFKQVNFFWVNW